MDIQNFTFLDPFVYLCVGCAVTIPLLFLNVRFAFRLGLIDWPKIRGVGEQKVPIVGPSLIAVSFVTLFVLMAYFSVSSWVVTCAAIIALMGYFDDRRPLGALDKFFFQLVCAATVVYLDPQISQPLVGQYGNVSLFAAVIFIVAVMNAVNFVDGVDGLAGIVLLSAFAAVPFLGSSGGHSQAFIILASLIVGALVPFLYLNIKVGKGFLGNTGSYFLSFLAAVAHLSVPLETSDFATRLSISALCFLIPLADAATVIVVRSWGGRSPFKPDKGHLHHRLVQTNIPLRYTLSVLGFIQLLGAVTGIFIVRSGGNTTPQLATVVLIGYGLITATLILLLERASRIRVQAYFQRLDSGDPIYYLKYQVNRVDQVPIQMSELVRLEAKFAAEIRVTDICVAQQTNCLFIVLRTMAEPLKGISARLEAVIHSERAFEFHLIERGDFTKRLSEVPQVRKTA
jgi:UDP-GlcNAc:undecaprenyl-phosphate/decaprenyl-phosphate GlcNAc-1-phosphate transferase